MNPEQNGQPEPCKHPAIGRIYAVKYWLIRRWVPVLALVFIFGLVIGLFVLYRSNPELIDSLERFGYLGAFLISIVLNATLVLPAGNFLVLAALGATLPSATLVGILGGLGAAIGESTGYLAGCSGRAIVTNQAMYGRTEGWMKKWGFWALFVLSAAPLFFDLAGIAAGACRYKYWKFFLACWLGRSLLYIAIAWAGLKGWQWLLDIAA